MFFAAVAHHFFFASRDFWRAGGVTPLVKMQLAEAEFERRKAVASVSRSRGSARTLSSDAPVIVTFAGKAGGGGGPPRTPSVRGATAAAAAAPPGAVVTPPSIAGPGTPARLGGGVSFAVDAEPGGCGELSPTATVEAAAAAMTPAPLSVVMREILPFDIVADTSDQIRSGFGLRHKWDKRKAEVRGHAGGAGDTTREGCVCLHATVNRATHTMPPMQISSPLSLPPPLRHICRPRRRPPR